MFVYIKYMRKKLRGRTEGEPPLNVPFPSSKVTASGEATPYFRPVSWIVHTMDLIKSFFFLVHLLHTSATSSLGNSASLSFWSERTWSVSFGMEAEAFLPCSFGKNRKR